MADSSLEYDPYDELIRSKLRAARLRAGYSQLELSKKSEVLCADIMRMEKGTLPLSIPKLRKIASAVGVSLGAFFSNEVELPPDQKPPAPGDPNYLIEPDEKKMIAAYRALQPGKERRIVIALAEVTRACRDLRTDPAARKRMPYWKEKKLPEPGSGAFGSGGLAAGPATGPGLATGQRHRLGAQKRPHQGERPTGPTLELSPSPASVEGAAPAPEDGVSSELPSEPAEPMPMPGPMPAPAPMPDTKQPRKQMLGLEDAGVVRIHKGRKSFASRMPPEWHAARNYEWMRDNGGKYPGQWVALRAGVLVDYDPDRHVLVERIYYRHREAGIQIGRMGTPSQHQFKALVGLEDVHAKAKIEELERQVKELTAAEAAEAGSSLSQK